MEEKENFNNKMKNIFTLLATNPDTEGIQNLKRIKLGNILIGRYFSVSTSISHAAKW